MLRLIRSIRARVTLGALLVVAVVLGVGAIAAVQILDRALTAGVAVAVEQDLETLGEQLERRALAVDTIDDEVLVRLQGERTQTNDEEAAALPVSPEDVTLRAEIDGEAYLVASEETDVGVLTVAHSMEHVDDAVTTATGLLAAAVPLVLVLVGGVVWVVAGRALAPVERLRRQVDAVDATGLEQRVDAGANDELGALADTMNRLLDRIQQAQIAQRRFVSDASHELRSPLATIRQHAELAAAHPAATSLASLSEVALEEGARMQELVEGLLLLARLDERHHQGVAEIDLDDLAFAEAARLRGIGVGVDTRSIAPGRVVGNEALLRRAVRNLGDNAARHARGTVTLRLATLGELVRLEVEDDGSGIPPKQRERVFERFARLDEGRARDEGGSGLGLAIVREIVLAHGGTVQASEGLQGGARFTVVLPAAPEV